MPAKSGPSGWARSRSGCRRVAGLLLRLPESERAALLKVASVRRERVSIGAVPRVAADAARDREAEARLKAALGRLAGRRGAHRQARRSGYEFDFRRAPAQRTRAVERRRLAWAAPMAERRVRLAAGVESASGVVAVGGGSVDCFGRGCGVARLSLFGAVAASVGGLGRDGAGQGRGARAGDGALRAAPCGAIVQHDVAALDGDVRESARAAGLDRARSAHADHRRSRSRASSSRTRSCSERMRVSLDELQAMTEAALEAARTGMGEELSREVDVAALVESMCADLADMGGEVDVRRGRAGEGACAGRTRSGARRAIWSRMRCATGCVRASRCATRARGSQSSSTTTGPV